MGLQSITFKETKPSDAVHGVPLPLPTEARRHKSNKFRGQARRSLRSNLVWTLIGDGTYAACQWGMLIVIAKLGSSEMVGQFALGLAITAPVIFLAGLALRSVQVTDMRSEYEFGEYLALRFTTTACALIVIVGLTCIVEYRQETAIVILCIGLAKALEAVSDIYYGLLQRHERMDLIATSMIIKGPLSLAALLAGILFSGNILLGTIGMAAAWGLVLLSYDIPVGTALLRRCGPGQSALPHWRPKRLAQLVWVAWPLGCTLMLLSLNINIPRYFVEHYLGERQLGVFAALAQIMLAGSVVVNALGQTASPRLARYWAENSLSAFRALLLALIALGTLLGVAGVLGALVAGRELLDFLYQSEYTTQYDVFVWLMSAAAISYLASALGYGLTAARVFWLQPLQLACATVAGTVSCMLLIPSQGLKGAAWAVGISLFVQLMIGLGGIRYFLQGSAQNNQQGFAAGTQATVT